MSLYTPLGEIVFNDLSGDATSASLAGLGGNIWPGPGVVPASVSAGWNATGLPAGNGYLMQFASGMHGGAVRNPVDNRPHKHGGIIHKFYSGPKYFTLQGLVVGDTPEIRQVLYDYLAGWVFSAMQTDCRFFFKPPGQATRFKTVRNYDATEIVGPQGTAGASPDNIAAPKEYTAQFVSVNPFSYTYSERDNGVYEDVPTIYGGGSVFIPNEGTADTWPVIEVYAPPSSSFLASFTLDNGTYQVEWAGNVAHGHYVEVDMFNETMYMDGNSTNELGGLNDQSDFWSIPPGGCTVSVTPGAHHIVVKSNDAWV